MRFVTRNAGRWLGLALVLATWQLLPVPLLGAEDPAGAQALQQAQRRMRIADDELKRARKGVGKADKRTTAAERTYQDALRKVDEVKADLDRAKQDLEAAKADAAQAQRRYDEAKASIETIYRLRQEAGQ